MGWLPLVRQNFEALHSVAEKSIPVVDTASALEEAVDEVVSSSLIKNGAVELGLLEELEEPLRAQADALSELVDEVRVRRNGWLVPSLWTEMDNLLDKAEEVGSSAEKAADLVALAPSMLGGSGERTYLVALMNNTELRGAGGILSGVGSVRLATEEYPWVSSNTIRRWQTTPRIAAWLHQKTSGRTSVPIKRTRRAGCRRLLLPISQT